MTISLTYTIDRDQIYKELANLLALRGPELQKMIDLFQEVQAGLKEEEEPPNVALIEEKIIEFRRSLVLVDLRLHEVSQMLKGYEASSSEPDRQPAPPPSEEGKE